MPHRILLLHGPNFGVLGIRQPAIYGTHSLEDLIGQLRILLSPGDELIPFQSNSEGALISFLNTAFAQVVNGQGPLSGILVNLGAYSHTSLALRDALEMFVEYGVPLFEIHLSNVFQRESFRHHSHISALCTGVICGLGFLGYKAALQYILQPQDR